MDKHWKYRSQTLLLRLIIVATSLWWTAGFAHAQELFSYSYGDPFAAGADDYIFSTSNAELDSEGPFRYWKPIVGGPTEASTTPAEIIFHFDLPGPSASIDLSMALHTFHWSYSRGHNLLYGSTDGTSWEQLADVQPPAFGGFNQSYAVTIPDTLLGAEDLWLRAELYSYGPSASSGGVLTNTAQLSRYDVTRPGPSFSLNVTTVPEPTAIGFLSLSAFAGLGLRRRRQR